MIIAATITAATFVTRRLTSTPIRSRRDVNMISGMSAKGIPVTVRRLVTMAPAFVVIAFGANATDALVYSQVVLSFALPVPMIALVIFTRRRDIMGAFANGRLVNAGAILGTAVILVLNVILLLQTFGANIPGLRGA